MEEIELHVGRYQEIYHTRRNGFRKLMKIYPPCGQELSHAARFWIIIYLMKKYSHLAPMSLARHFDVNRHLFDSTCMNKLRHPTYYGYLSPGEASSSSVKGVVINYGRDIDRLNFFDELARKKELKESQKKYKRNGGSNGNDQLKKLKK